MSRMPTRDDCPTCNEKRDHLGRICIGFCHPTECLMAKERAARLANRPARPAPPPAVVRQPPPPAKRASAKRGRDGLTREDVFAWADER